MNKIFNRATIALSVTAIALYMMCTSCILAFWDKDHDDKTDSDSTEVKTFVDQMMKQFSGRKLKKMQKKMGMMGGNPGGLGGFGGFGL